MTRSPWVIGMAAALEMVVGGVLLVFVDEPCLLLFGSKPAAVAPIVRLAGLALAAFGFVCFPSRQPSSRATMGLLAFNVGVATLFTAVGVATTQHGVLLWPAAILHAGLAAALLFASPRLKEAAHT